MAVINEPKYDEDVVNLGYLRRILGLKDTDSVSIVVTKNYGTAPTPPYSLNDTYMYEGKVYICINARNVGEFNPNDWVLMADNSALGDFATNGSLNNAVGQLNQKIESTATGINIEVAKKLNKSDFTHANIVLAINDNTSSVLINGDKISLAGKVLNLTSDNISINSSNFSVDKNGKITSKSGDIAGFVINGNSFTKNINGIYNYNNFDIGLCIGTIMEHIATDSNIRNVLDASNDGALDSSDLVFIRQILLGQRTNNKTVTGTFEINSNSPKDCMRVKDSNGNIVASMGVGGVNSTYGTFNNIILGTPTASSSYEEGTTITLNGANGAVRCTSLTQTSLESEKKNIETYENGLQEVLKTDIYKYNFKKEEDDSKKHVGFVIGDKYNYSDDITSVNSKGDSNGVDLYSMTAVAFNAIQELYEIIKLQQKEITELKEKLK